MVVQLNIRVATAWEMLVSVKKTLVFELFETFFESLHGKEPQDAARDILKHKAILEVI